MQFTTIATLAAALFAGQSLADCYSGMQHTIQDGQSHTCRTSTSRDWTCGNGGAFIARAGSNDFMMRAGPTDTVFSVRCSNNVFGTFWCDRNSYGKLPLANCDNPSVNSIDHLVW
ncbi:hypothetical protein E4U21_004322 [Claviceps maximensis]|nr:hypothetical protein E4U21_004322 [Claviceps maximensis]